MDSFEINSLFNDQKIFKNYVKKDLIRVYDSILQPGSNRLKFTCHHLVNKLIDYSDGFILFEGYISSTTANPLTNGDIVDIQNGANCLFKDVKVSFNNNEVEHNRRPDISTTWLNLLEYSDDYARSVAVQYGFARDTVLTGANTAATFRAETGDLSTPLTVTAAGGGLPDRYEIKYLVPLKYLSQFFRRLNFPIINQLMEIEMAFNPVNSIYRVGAQPSEITMVNAQMLLPEVILPTNENIKLMKGISSGNFSKDFRWDATDYVLTNTNVQANTQFEILLGTNLVGVKKLFFMVHGNVNNQLFVQTGSNISIRNFNVEIDSKDFYNMNVQTDHEAYRIVSENFNNRGQDLNTGSLLDYIYWRKFSRLYVIDLSRQEIFESDPNTVQTIRLRGTPDAAGQLLVILSKNKTTRIDFSDPQNTKTV